MNPERVDWSQLWYPGPTRVFSADELARAGADAPSRTLWVMGGVNLALLAMMVLQVAPPQATARLTALLIGGLAGGVWLALRLWQRPDRRLLAQVTLGYIVVMLLLGLGLKWRVADPDERRWAFGVCWGLSITLPLLFWFVAVYRADQIAARLRELAERDRAVDMARQLAAAQIQPHFLFNSLAALQHWVQVKDDRAAPMLQALTGFLRATLPLFNRARLRLGDEADAVMRYLDVMQLRLGQRLRFAVDVSPAAAAVEVPPGLVLTLVENAIVHAVMPSLQGADVRVRAGVDAGWLQLDVTDDGPGPAPGSHDGVGLANTRARLLQAFGPRATLQLDGAAGGGCLARIRAPLDL